MNRPSHLGLRHVAIFSDALPACVKFYTEFLGFKIEWQPDAENIYLSSGCDNLALHQAKNELQKQRGCLDHIGILVDSHEAVDEWFAWLSHCQVKILKTPTIHRDGAKSFYCADPENRPVQIIYHPPISKLKFNPAS